MASTGSRPATVRLAAALLASLVVAFAVLTYLSYTAAFTSTETVTVASPRAGLVMEKGAKVKFRGIQVGKVEDISYSGDQARLKLAINSNQLRFIPSNATVHIAGKHHLRRQVSGIRGTRQPVEDVAAPGFACASRRLCSWKSTPCSSRSSTCCTRSTRSN